jgi:hypothetical protein
LPTEDIRIRFVNFWDGFDHGNNFFLDLIESEGLNASVHQSNSCNVDLEIVSVFSNKKRELVFKSGRRLLGLSNNPTQKNRLANLSIPRRPKGAARRIWYTGENIRIPFQADFDGYLSFDPSHKKTNNAYLPLWMLSVGWFSKSIHSRRIGIETHIDDLLRSRTNSDPKKKDVCAFVGNPEPFRLRFIEELGASLQVDAFGSYFGNFATNKFDVAKDYRFSIAFENDLYPGYVTEKIVESYLVRNVPIYRGILDLNSEIEFNPKAFINLQDYKDADDMSEYISSLSAEEYDRMYSEPLLLKHPKLTDIKNVLLG